MSRKVYHDGFYENNLNDIYQKVGGLGQRNEGLASMLKNSLIFTSKI
jgi:hypothetical protein